MAKAQSTELATTAPAPLVRASTMLGHALGMETDALIDTLKSQFFKSMRPDQVTDAQLATVITISNAMGLNPLLPGQLYPYPNKNGGVEVMLGPDGIYTLLSNNNDVVARSDGGAAWWTEHGKDEQGKEICTGYINHRTKGLLKKTIWVDEWVVSSNPNWSSRRHHMSETRALKQVARMVIHGIPSDSDEHRLGEMLNVTPGAEGEQKLVEAGSRPKVERSTRGAAGAQSAPNDDKTIDISATTPKVAEPNPVDAKPADAPPKVEEKPVAPPKADAPAAPRKELKAGEIANFVCDVVSFVAKNFTPSGQPTLACKVELRGEFEGVVYDKNVKANGDKVVASPAWQLEQPVRVTLEGRAAGNGKVGIVVQNVEVVENEVP